MTNCMQVGESIPFLQVVFACRVRIAKCLEAPQGWESPRQAGRVAGQGQSLCVHLWEKTDNRTDTGVELAFQSPKAGKAALKRKADTLLIAPTGLAGRQGRTKVG